MPEQAMRYVDITFCPNISYEVTMELRQQSKLHPDAIIRRQPVCQLPGSKATAATTDNSTCLPVRGSLSVREKMTTPPTYLTESDLIGLMEKNGIGTDASIPAHIQNIQNRNYVTLESGRRLIPGKLGLVLVQGYHQIDSSLVLPQVRSDIEDQCNKICKGIASKDDVVKRALALFRGKFDLFVENIGKMDVLFGSSFAKLEVRARSVCNDARRAEEK